MKHSTGKPTKSEAARIAAIKAGGCLACHQHGLFRFAEAHHILSGGVRMGHHFTIALCGWHHRGAGEGEGPSMEKQPKEFARVYGTELQLLEIQNKRIGQTTPVYQKRRRGSTARPEKILARRY